MYICNKFNMNLCPLCKLNHDKNHKLINYEDKYYINAKYIIKNMLHFVLGANKIYVFFVQMIMEAMLL